MHKFTLRIVHDTLMLFTEHTYQCNLLFWICVKVWVDDLLCSPKSTWGAVENIGAKYYKTSWLYNRTKITIQVHKFPLCIVNDTVMRVIEHTHLFKPVFKIFEYLQHETVSWTTHAQTLKLWEHTNTHSAHINMLKSI